MKPTLYSQIADVFDKLADEEMRKETPKTEERPARPGEKAEAKEKAPEPEDPSKLASDSLREILGGEPDAATVAKVAGDSEMLGRVRKLAAEQRRPERLGGPGDRSGTRPDPRNRKEAAQAAYDRFGDFLLNGGRD